MGNTSTDNILYMSDHRQNNNYENVSFNYKPASHEQLGQIHTSLQKSTKDIYDLVESVHTEILKPRLFTCVSIDKKVIISLFFSSLLSGGLLLLTVLSFYINTLPEPIFWMAMTLPLLGISLACLTIMLGIDKDRYTRE